MLVLPEPVGPVTSRMPSGARRSRSKISWSSLRKPSSGRPRSRLDLIEQPHDHALAVVGRHGRDAQVDRFLSHLHLDATVLREALLRDAHRAGHDLEPADDGRLQFLRRRLHFLEHAVDPEPDAKTFLERLEMDVARAELVRLEQEHRDHPDDRRVAALAFRQLGALGDVEFLDRGIADFFAQDIDRFLCAAVILDQRLPDFFGRGADQLDLALQQEAEAVDAVEIERIARRDDEAVLVARDRDHLKPARVLRLDLIDHLLRHDDVGEIDPRAFGPGQRGCGRYRRPRRCLA